jgi:hypothetical protein
MGGKHGKPVGPSGSTQSKGVKYDEHGNISECLFCNIAAGKEPPSTNKKARPEEQRLQGKLLYEVGSE